VNYLVEETAIQEPSVITKLRMNRRLGRLIFFPLSVLLGWITSFSQAQAQGQLSPLATGLDKEFASETASVNEITLHYVRGGRGPAVILIHGFPQDWFEYHAIMPRLAKQFTVIAVDLRGVGGSTTTPGGYEAANMAEDVHQLAAALKLGKGKRLRTLPVPSWSKELLNAWLRHSGVNEGKVFRRVLKGEKRQEAGVTANVVWYAVKRWPNRPGLRIPTP